MEATRLADLSSWPASLDDAEDFGDELLERVNDHFRITLEAHNVDLTAAETVWTELKQALYSNDSNVHSMTWAQINDMHRGKWPNILDVIDLLLSLPAGSSECERGFSQMKKTKTVHRNRMSSDTLTTLMTIQLHSPDCDTFQPDTSIHYWNSHHHRRPNFLRKKEPAEEAIPNSAGETPDDSNAGIEMEGDGGDISDWDRDDVLSDCNSDFSDYD